LGIKAQNLSCSFSLTFFAVAIDKSRLTKVPEFNAPELYLMAMVPSELYLLVKVALDPYFAVLVVVAYPYSWRHNLAILAILASSLEE